MSVALGKNQKIIDIRRATFIPESTVREFSFCNDFNQLWALRTENYSKSEGKSRDNIFTFFFAIYLFLV